MSIRVITDLWECSNLKGTSLLLMLAVADYCDDARTCWPATKTLANKARLSQRQTQRLLHQLEEAGHLIIHKGEGRHGTNLYEIPARILLEKLKALPPGRAWGDTSDGVTSATQGGDTSDAEGVTPVTPKPSVNRHEPSLLSGVPERPPLKKPRKRRVSKADPRSSHPAIRAVKSATRRYPPLELYDTVIEVLGDVPDVGKMKRMRKEWLVRGYNQIGWGWLTDWYRKDTIPTNGKRTEVGSIAPVTDADMAERASTSHVFREPMRLTPEELIEQEQMWGAMKSEEYVLVEGT